MTAVRCQRWKNGRTGFRPAEPINTSKFEVAEIPDDTTAKAFVKRHHYSRSFPAARFRVGLFRKGPLRAGIERLAGVAVFSHPPSEAVLAKLPCERLAGVELGRFVLEDEDDVKGNAESWLLGQCFELLRAHGIECLISHSDPLPRRSLDGKLILPGHVGIIYQATNAIYAGRARAQKLNLLPNGSCFTERSMTKVRLAQRGWERDVEVLVTAGAPRPVGLVAGGEEGDPRYEARRAWMWDAITQVCRRVKHYGNHQYLWALDSSLRKQIATMAARDDAGELVKYPKQRDPEPEAAAGLEVALAA